MIAEKHVAAPLNIAYKNMRAIYVILMLPFLVGCTRTDELLVSSEFIPVREIKSEFSAGAGKSRPHGTQLDDKVQGQVFIPLQTGRLLSVEAIVTPMNVEATAPLVVSVLKMRGGLPSSPIAITSVERDEIHPENRQRTTLRNLDFTIKAVYQKRPILWRGHSYAIKFSSDQSSADYHISGTTEPNDPYPLGARFSSWNSPVKMYPPGDGDFYFRVTASKVRFAPIIIILTFVGLALTAIIFFLLRHKPARSE